MEHAPGVQLHGKWPKLNPVQHMRCVRALAKTIKSMAALSFPAYGSIYFADAQLDPHTTTPLGDFCIGPNCMREYWDCNPGESRYYQQRNLNNGPCKFPCEEILSNKIDSGIREQSESILQRNT